jgi:N-hydroxyarylamine O-acetyltransferase
MGNFDVDRYLEHIAYEGSREPTLETLAALHLTHLIHVPFENLHVFHRLGVRVDVGWSYEKIVEQRRGGWCFELNGCFAELLRRLGFTVDLISCRTFEPDSGGLSPDFDHLALLVHAGGDAFLVDVGWGDNPLAVLPAENGDYATRPRPSRVEANGDVIRLIQHLERVDGEVVWELQYEATRHPRRLEDFEPRSRYLQTEPGLMWTDKPLVTRATSPHGGRVSLHRDRLRVRSDDLTIDDRPVSPEEWDGVLQSWFGMAPPTVMSPHHPDTR